LVDKDYSSKKIYSFLNGTIGVFPLGINSFNHFVYVLLTDVGLVELNTLTMTTTVVITFEVFEYCGFCFVNPYFFVDSQSVWIECNPIVLDYEQQKNVTLLVIRFENIPSNFPYSNISVAQVVIQRDLVDMELLVMNAGIFNHTLWALMRNDITGQCLFEIYEIDEERNLTILQSVHTPSSFDHAVGIAAIPNYYYIPPSNEPPKKRNLALIIGVSIGASAVLVLAMVLMWLHNRPRKLELDNDRYGRKSFVEEEAHLMEGFINEEETPSDDEHNIANDYDDRED